MISLLKVLNTQRQTTNYLNDIKYYKCKPAWQSDSHILTR